MCLYKQNIQYCIHCTLYWQTIHVYVWACILISKYMCAHTCITLFTVSLCPEIRSILNRTPISAFIIWLMFFSLHKLSSVSSLPLFHMTRLELSETNAQKVQALSFLFFRLLQKWSVIVVTLRGFLSFDLYNAIIYKLMGGRNVCCLHFNFHTATSAFARLLWYCRV